MNEKLQCPICNNFFENLYFHLKRSHGYKNKTQILNDFPKLKLVNDNRKRVNIKCEICNKEFKTLNALIIHKKYIHKILTKKDNKKEDKKLKCEICGNFYNQLETHVSIKHNLSFDEYRKKFNYFGPASFFSEKHKQNLKENKLKFYETEEGKKWRENNSKKFFENNPSKNNNVRKKFSESAIKRMKNGENAFFSNSFGIMINFYFNGNYYFVRSFEEFKIIFSLLENEIDFEYEKHTFNYFLDNKLKTYLIDLKINEIFYEIKGDSEKNLQKYLFIEKYKQIKETLNKIGKTFIIINYKTFCKNFNLDFKFNDYFYVKLKRLLDEDKCKIQQTLFNIKSKPKIIMKIDKNFLLNKNIKISYKNEDKQNGGI